MYGDRHAVTTQWRDHTCGITAHEDMIFYRLFCFKGDLVDHLRLIKKKLCPFKYIPEVWILCQYLLLHFMHLAMALEVIPFTQIAQVIFPILDPTDPTISPFEVMQGHGIIRVTILADVVLDPNVG